jgi:ubiquitin-protein ligase
MPTPRERRLLKEFERMKALRTPHSLFSFYCASLDESEASEFLRSDAVMDIAEKGLKSFLKPEDFMQRYGDVAPEKYLIKYSCKGLIQQKNGDITTAEQHAMEIVFGLEYPSAPPTFIWWTPIWHPNFNTPHICIQGHPWAVGLNLDHIVLEVGRMVQYQNYNVKDPLNAQAAEWARKNPGEFPIDHRDILNANRRVWGRRTPLVEILVSDEVAPSETSLILDLVDLVEETVGPDTNIRDPE